MREQGSPGESPLGARHISETTYAGRDMPKGHVICVCADGLLYIGTGGCPPSQVCCGEQGATAVVPVRVRGAELRAVVSREVCVHDF